MDQELLRVYGILTNALVTIVVSVLLAWLSFRYFESPFLKMRKRFSRRPTAVVATQN